MKKNVNYSELVFVIVILVIMIGAFIGLPVFAMLWPLMLVLCPIVLAIVAILRVIKSDRSKFFVFTKLALMIFAFYEAYMIIRFPLIGFTGCMDGCNDASKYNLKLHVILLITAIILNIIMKIYETKNLKSSN